MDEKIQELLVTLHDEVHGAGVEGKTKDVVIVEVLEGLRDLIEDLKNHTHTII